jgi:hypothetical protein
LGHLRADLTAVFGEEGDVEILDNRFQYVLDNCATFPGQLLAAALKAERSGRRGELALIHILRARPNSPLELGQRLRWWTRRFGGAPSSLARDQVEL